MKTAEEVYEFLVKMIKQTPGGIMPLEEFKRMYEEAAGTHLEWGQQLPLGGFEVWVPASPLVSPIIVDSLTEFPNEDENRLVLGGIKEGDEPRTASVSATIRIQGGVAYFPPTNEQLEVWSREPIPVHWENSQNGSRLWRYFTPVYKGTWKWRWMKIKKWFSRIK